MNSDNASAMKMLPKVVELESTDEWRREQGYPEASESTWHGPSPMEGRARLVGVDVVEPEPGVLVDMLILGRLGANELVGPTPIEALNPIAPQMVLLDAQPFTLLMVGLTGKARAVRLQFMVEASGGS